MNRRALQSHVLCILSTLLLLFTFSTTHALAEFYVIAGSRGVGTQIRSLPYTISSPGFYYITKDLTCAAGVHGITIEANDVTLDLMGFSLVGPGGTGDYDGINMAGRINVEIRNGTVRNFQRHGIYEVSTEGTGHRIVNIRTRDNGSIGIALSGRCHIVERCTAVGNYSYGIYAGTGSTVTGNTSYSNGGSGIYAINGSTVTGNTCYDNPNYGIYLDGYNLVDQNTAHSNGTNMNSPTGCVFGTNVGAP
jgi:parallel beta-helix repeat protein